MTIQEHWTRQTARELRALADVLEQAENLKMGTYSWGDTREPVVALHLAGYEDVNQLAGLLGGVAGIGGYDLSEYGVWVHKPAVSIHVTTPAITIPRACPFCDEKHDCTHTDGMVA